MSKKVENKNNSCNSFIETLEEESIPLYFSLFYKIKKKTDIPIFFQVLVLFFIHFCFAFFIVDYSETTKCMPMFWIFYILILFFIICGFYFIYYMWRKHLTWFGDEFSIIRTKEKIDELKKSFITMYNGNSQISYFLIFGIVLIFFLYNLYPAIPNIAKVFILYFMIFPCAGLGGLGFRLAVTSCVFIYKFSKIGISNIRFNPIFPGNTVGIAKLARLMSSYATLYIIQNTLYLFPFVYFSLNANSFNPPVDLSSFSYRSVSFIILIFVFFLLPLYFVYPQIILRILIIREKERLQREIEDELRNSFYLPIEENIKYDKISYYSNVFIRIKNSPTMPIDFFSIFKFVGSLSFSILLIFSSTPGFLSNIIVILKNIIKIFSLK